MTDREYLVKVTMDHSVPASVLEEHIRHALKRLQDDKKVRPEVKAFAPGGYTDTKVTYAKKTVRDHPFDGPEFFDDYITNDKMSNTAETIQDDYPHLAAFFEWVREDKEHRE